MVDKPERKHNRFVNSQLRKKYRYIGRYPKTGSSRKDEKKKKGKIHTPKTEELVYGDKRPMAQGCVSRTLRIASREKTPHQTSPCPASGENGDPSLTSTGIPRRCAGGTRPGPLLPSRLAPPGDPEP